MQHFLLIYDHAEQRLRDEPRRFDADEIFEATGAYQDAEQRFRDQPQIEIVLIGADSIETIERTHGHYFRDQDRLAKYLTPS